MLFHFTGIAANIMNMSFFSLFKIPVGELFLWDVVSELELPIWRIFKEFAWYIKDLLKTAQISFFNFYFLKNICARVRMCVCSSAYARLCVCTHARRCLQRSEEGVQSS